MSNIELSKTIIDAVSDVFKTTNRHDREFNKVMDVAKKHIHWTQAVSPTESNIASGKSTASKESYTQLKDLATKTLTPATKKLFNLDKARAEKAGYETDAKIGGEWVTAQGAVGVKMKDLKNELMKRQDPELYKATKGNLSKVVKVSVDKKAEVKEATTKTTFETGEQMAKNYLAWIEKNKEGLGEKYDTIRNAHIKAMEASGYKR